MKTLISTLGLAVGMTIAALGGANADPLRVAVAAEPYPPFASPDASGNWTGWEVDLAKAVCKAEKLDCVITPVAWDGIIPALTSNKIDVIAASMSITPEREKTIDFSDKYYNTPTAIVAAKDSGYKPTPEGMSGKIIGVQVSTIHEDYVRKHFPDAEVRTYQTQDEANQDLVAGRIDATQADKIALDAFLESADGSACCESIGEVAPDVEVLGPGVGFGLRKGEDDLKAKLNAGIKAIREDGTYEAISKPYFNFDIYGG
ncbi:transporter substrate-binding domain-containing protein [Mangrovibrevibacter kandeliae]|uniref:transporter substrate-binding domain-containing protein n=1 Tax=Mangrovibrevibacter kandeliae TaxID=2968473 RepID=UPI003899BEAF